MFIPLVPPPVDNFGESGVLISALEGADIGQRPSSSRRSGSFGGSSGQGITGICIDGRFGFWRGFRAVLEYRFAVRAGGLVDGEEVKVIMLDNN